MLSLLGYLVQVTVLALYLADVAGVKQLAEALDKVEIADHPILNNDIVQILEFKRIPDIPHKV